MWHFFLHEILNFASTEPLIYSQRSIEKQIYLLKIKQPKLGCYDKTQLRISFKDFVLFFRVHYKDVSNENYARLYNNTK